MKRIITFLVLLFGVLSTLMAGTPVDMYLTGDFNGWKFESKYQFSKVADNSYEIDLGKSPLLLKPGVDFKILSSDYDTYDYGTTSVSDCGTSYTLVKDKGSNCEVQSLILFSKVTFSTLTNEMILHCANDGEYSKTATLYIGAPCGNDSESIGFGAFATEADFNNGAPYAIVKAQKVPSMYIHGYQVYKAEIPFDERVYVASMGYSSFSSVCKEFTEEGAWYCASPFPDIYGCYRSFDEARFNVDLIDLNFKPEANTLYVIGRTPQLTVYSSEYGIEQGKEINFEGALGYTLKGKGIHYYPVTNVDIFDMVRYDGEDMAIDWNKPFFYEGERYASLKDVPVDEIKESSCWRLWGLNTTSMVLYHVGNNVYKETYTNWTIVPTDEALDITLGNHSSNVSGCVRQIKAIATPEQTGRYNITFTYDANTQNLTHEWELVSADAISVKSSDIVGYFYGSSYAKNLDAKMELVGVNEYKYTCKAEMEKGLKYYTIKDSYSNFTAKDILFQIPETGLYEFTFTYNAVTQKYACDVKKSYDFDPIYFRGTVNEWGVDEKYKLTTTDGDYYVATYATGKEVELGDPEGGIAKFKIGSGNDIWYPIDFGYSNSQNKYLTAGTPCILASDGSDVTIVGSLKASKIEFTKSTGTLLVTAAQAESEYTTVYVVNENRLQNIYAFARPITSPDYDDVEVEKLPKTYQGYEVYSYTFKSIYDQLMINGTGGNSISNLTVNKVKPYYYDGVWYETLDMEDAKPTYIYLVNTSGMDLEKITKYYSNLDRTGQVKQPVLISEKVAGYDVYRFEVDAVATGIVWYTPDYSPEIGYPFGVEESEKLTPYYANGVWYESLADIKIDQKPEEPTVFDTTTDQGVAFVVNPNSANPVFVPLTYSYNAEFQTAQYTGTYTVTDLDFTAKIGGLTNLDVINYGTNGQALQPNYLYNPTRGASNGFTITGDYKVGDILNINATFDSDWNVTLIIDVTKTLEPTPNDITLYYVNSNEWDTVNGYVWPTGGTGILEWPGAPATKIDKTVDGYDVYSYTFDSTKADNIIFNAGLGGAQTKDLAVNASKPYYYGGVWYETLTFDGEQGGDQGGEEGGDDTGDVEIGEPANLYIIGALTGWSADATWQFSTADDEYFVLSFPKGQEQELSGQFKVASSNWSPYNYGAPLDLGSVEAGKEYVLEYNVATNLSIANIIKVSKIEFTLSTQTLKITGATEEKVFDTTSDYGFYLYADYKDYPFTFKGNGVYEYDYTSEGPSSTIGDYQYKTVEWGRNSTGNQVTLGELYQLGLSNHPISFPDATTGQTLTIVLTVSSDWSATILVKEKSSEEGGEEGGDDTDPIVPETAAYVVRGNGGSDATGIWCGGIEWTNDDSPVNNMTDADKDGIYEVTYKNVPAGTWNFKVVGTTEGWMGSDFLDTKNSSAGYTTAPYDGNIGFTLNAPADVTIKFNTLTGKIIVTTPSGSFGKVVIEHFHILTGNNQCLDEFEFTEANNYTLVLTQEVIIDEEYGVAYVGCGILGNCDYAVYEKYFSIEVTENGTYTVTVQFNGDYENPDFTVTAVKQGGSTDPEDPDNPDTPVVPDPVIGDIAVPTFPQIEVGETATATLTYTLENATTATASIESDAFYIMSQSVENGEGTVKILFMPEAKGVHTATISIKSGNVTETTMIVAKAVEPAPEVVPAIKNVVLPAFTSIEKGTATSVTATFTLENATEVSATLSGTGKDAFVLGQPELNGGNGSVKIVFMPTEAGTYTATLTLTSGKAVQTATISAVATEPAPQVSITNIQVPAFDEIYVGDFTAINVTYTLENATKSSVSISGTNADVFIAQNNKVTNGKGSLQVIFLPESAGLYTATLTISAGDVSESVTLVAIAKLEQTEDPGETVVNISNLQVPEFASVVENETTTVIASYVLTGAKDATARISGTDAKYFTILSQEVSEGIGQVEIEFAPNAARTFNATLTIISGTESESIDFSASALAAPVISNIQVPEFAETYVDETQTVLATYTLENAEAATATLSGDVEVFSISKQILSGGNGLVRIDFAPKSKGTYKATLMITSGKVTESVNFSATAIVEETEELPIISNLNVPAFDEVYEGESAIVIATYTLENATEATATLSGDDVFSILRSLNGKVLIEFAPAETGTYNGTLTITSGSVSESIDFSAKAVEEGGEEPGPGPEDPDGPENPDGPDTPVVPDPLPEYPVRGYLYVVNTPDAELEKMVKYKPVSIDKVDYFLAPEKIETKIYGYDIYKFEVRDEEMIDLWEYPNAQYTSWHIDVNVDLSATPYLANGVWYSSIEEMMTWYVRYIPNWDDETSEVMIEESPGVYVATFDAFAESDDNDKYYYCLGNVEDPILEVGVGESGNILNYLQIPQGFKAMIYLDDTNWETEWKTYYKLVPPGKDWDRDCIDLGLTSGLCWATKNLGATEPQQEGTHFAWGEVEPKEDYSYNTYKWANLLKNNEYIKYVTDDYWGTIVDFRTTLEPTDDAANVALEGKWHMPTQADVEELLRECTTEFGSYYGVNGYFVTGPNGNAIFLPAVGIKEGTDYEESTRGGDYWTSSLYEDNQKYAVTLSFALTYIEIDDMQRTNGLAIRPVIHKDYVGIEEVVAINVYAKDRTIYCEEPFQIYTVTGLDVTHLNGALEGVYIVKTEKGNKLISVW